MLLRGYTRALLAYNAGGDCSPVYATEQEAFDSLANLRLQQECQDGGGLLLLADQLTAQNVQTAASQCVGAGRTDVTFAGGASRFADGGLLDFFALRRALEDHPECLIALPLLAPTDPINGCTNTLECAPRDGGVACVPDPTCQGKGSCRSPAVEGEGCGEFAPPCAQGLTCHSATGRCAVAQGVDGDCTAAPCLEGLFCNGAVCTELGSGGAFCTSSFQCQKPLVCLGTTCGMPAPDGGACQSGFDCAPCQFCVNSTCMLPRSAGESCALVPCHAGLVCNAAERCTTYSANAQPCTAPAFPDADQALQGTCLDENLACPYAGCDGGPCAATCQTRAAILASCNAMPGEAASQGTCAAGLWCQRTATAETTGSCLAPLGSGNKCMPEGLGQPAEKCAYPLQCHNQGDGGAVCLLNTDLSLGQYCQNTGECIPGAYCDDGAGGSPGRCSAAPDGGLTCSNTVEMQYPGHACAPGLYCSDTCMQQNGVGQGCMQDAQCSSGLCDDGNCHLQYAPGAYCPGMSPMNECADGACINHTCIVPGCSAPPNPTGARTVWELLARLLFLG